MERPSLAQTQPEPRLLATGEIAAVPTVEVAVHCAKSDFNRLFGALWSLVVRPKLCSVPSVAVTLIAPHESASTGIVEMSSHALDQWEAHFRRAAGPAIRQTPVTIFAAGLSPSSNAPAFVGTVRLSLGMNFFPDDAVQLSISVTSSRANAWQELAALRDNLLPSIGDNFCWSTLGFGFVCDLDNYIHATASMEHLCMRLLGVDLQDPFGGYVSTQHLGPRSVNWQVCVRPDWLEKRAKIRNSAIEAAIDHRGSLLWQADELPSVCDRNDPADHAAIAKYAALDRLLAPALYVPRLPWFPGWDELTTERWLGRWQEVQH